MQTNKQKSFIVLGLLLFGLLALSIVRSFAQEAIKEVYFPIIFKQSIIVTPPFAGSATQTPASTSTPTGTTTSTSTSTPTATTTVTPSQTSTSTVDCALFSLNNFILEEANRTSVQIKNSSEQDVNIIQLKLDWESAQAWALATGYVPSLVDWFDWNGDRFYTGDDYDSPTVIDTNLNLTADSSGSWVSDLDFSGESSWLIRDVFGLTEENFGFQVVLDNGCSLYRPETLSLPPELDCGAYSIGDFYFGSYAHVLVDLVNGDQFGTQVTNIEFDWDYAESFDALVEPQDELNMDFMSYGGRTTWGNGDGGERDYDSFTSTSLDAPDTFPGSWSSYGLPPFAPGTSYTLEVDFDNEWPTFNQDLISDDFGVRVTFENGCVVEKLAVARPLPSANCDLYSLSGFSIEQSNRIRADVTNGDILSTEVERIVLDWDYAEAMSDLMLGPDGLFTDWMQWDFSDIWSAEGDGIGDLASYTDTSSDSPGAWRGPSDFNAGDTVQYLVDYDLATEVEYDEFQDWGIAPSDFGVTFYFANGCVLESPAVPRPMPTHLPLDVILLIDISESMSWDAPDGNILRDPSVCNDFTLFGGSEDAGEYPSFPDGIPGECHPFEAVKNAAAEVVLRILDQEEDLEEDRLAVVTFGNGWSSNPNMGTHLRTDFWTSDSTTALSIIRDLKIFSPDICDVPDPLDPNYGFVYTYWGPCRKYIPPESSDYQGLYCYSCNDALDFSYTTSSNLGGGLLLAGNMTAYQHRPEASSVVILISGGFANATNKEQDDDIVNFSTYPTGFCPNDWTFPLCQDEDISSRHGSEATLYDADDFARDVADYVGCDSIEPALGCQVAGMGANVFSIGVSDMILDHTNEINGLPYGVALLRYIAAVGDDGDPETDPCESYWNDENDWTTWCGNYYYTDSSTQLSEVMRLIIQRLFLGVLR